MDAAFACQHFLSAEAAVSGMGPLGEPDLVPPYATAVPQPPGPLPYPPAELHGLLTLGGCATLSSQQPSRVPAGPGNPDTHPSVLGFLSCLG